MFLILTILFTSAICFGIKISTEEGMVFYNLRVKAEIKCGRRYPDGSFVEDMEDKSSIWDAIILCAWCMPSIYTSFGFGFAYLFYNIEGFTWNILWLLFYPIAVCAASFISGMAYMIYMNLNLSNIVKVGKINNKVDLENEEEIDYFEIIKN